MNVTFPCPKCEQAARAEADDETTALRCGHCGQELAVPAGAIEAGRLRRCLACPSTDLYVRKDFPQKLGVGIVVLGFAASCVAWAYHQVFWTFAILFATALLDVVLYALFGNALTCYRCGATYRDVEGLDEHNPFDLEVHEKHRQQEARKEKAVGSRQ